MVAVPFSSLFPQRAMPEDAVNTDADTAVATALHLLRHPARPLLTLLGFFLRAGDFEDAEAVLAELPDPIETGTAVYARPREHLTPYLDAINRFSCPEAADLPTVLDGAGRVLPPELAADALLAQRVLELELERINSLLCGARRCELCCTGPDAAMRQDFFYIPLRPEEPRLFSGLRRLGHSGADLEGLAGDFGAEALLASHGGGASLVLPRNARCPALDAAGRCAIYPRRPLVCRRPQIFPYLLEAEGDAYRLRNALLAVVDCPYVRDLQEDIARYAAACELEPVFRRNKE